MSVLRELFSRLFNWRSLTLGGIVKELNATLRRTEEARIYHWMNNVEQYPPPRSAEAETTARLLDGPQAALPPPPIPIL